MTDVNESLRGFAFPFRIDPASGGVARVEGHEKLRDNLLFLLQVELGERVLRREYGAGLRRLIHEPVNAAFLGLIKSQIVRAIAQGEPRIELADLSVRAGLDPGTLEVELLYSIRASQVPQRFVAVLDALGRVSADPGAGS